MVVGIAARGESQVADFPGGDQVRAAVPPADPDRLIHRADSQARERAFSMVDVDADLPALDPFGDGCLEGAGFVERHVPWLSLRG